MKISTREARKRVAVGSATAPLDLFTLPHGANTTIDLNTYSDRVNERVTSSLVVSRAAASSPDAKRSLPLPSGVFTVTGGGSTLAGGGR